MKATSSSIAAEEMTGSREEPWSVLSAPSQSLYSSELLTPLATSNTSRKTDVRNNGATSLHQSPTSPTSPTNRCIYPPNDRQDELMASTALKHLTERERMNERLTLRDMVGESPKEIGEIGALDDLKQRAIGFGMALFDPLDLENLSCEIPREIRQDAATAPLLPPTPTLTLTTSISEPNLSHSSPLATTKSMPSLASLTCTTEQDSVHFSDEEEHYPVEIEPESASSLRACPRLLTDSMIQQLHDSLPDALQMNKWERCFSIGRDGDSFLTFTNFCAPYQYTLIAIKTVSGHLLGGFATESWGGKRKKQYFGTGHSFVFCDHPAVIPGYDAELDPSKELHLYGWSGDNNYCQICNSGEQRLAMGGVGDFGLIIQDHFNRGQTGRCRTYNNPPLTPDPAGLFEIESLEVYGMVPLFQSMSPAGGSLLVTNFSGLIMSE
jgi:hypothetical protein